MATRSASPLPDANQAPPSTEAASTTELLRRLTEQLVTLFRQELRLATAELSQALTKLLSGVISAAAGGAMLYAGFLVLLAAAVLGLAVVWPAWLAALAVGAAVTLVGLVLLYRGKKTVDPSSLKPQRTIDSLQQDKDVLTRRNR
jgi:uncharacterized membrane protein YqjE